MISHNVKSFLDKNRVKYRTIKHTPAFTAQEVAAAAHIPGKELAKIIVIKIDGKLAMIVEPANLRTDFKSLQRSLGAKHVELANEYEFKDRFPECETGAMPPFGTLFSMDVYLDDAWDEDKLIAFNGGNHSELIEMSYKDFLKIAKPKVLRLH